jgi:Mrp family chromosome partitioning ATPase
MSAIDQAFIRAYEIDEVGHASSSRATAKAPQRVAPIQPSTVVEKIAVQAAVEAAVAQPQVKPVAVQARSVAHSPPPAATAVPSSSIVAEPPAERPSVEPARTSQRRPLSTFAQPTQVVEARFKPALEVDSFRWSAVTEQLIRRCGAQLQPAVATLLAADDAGRSLHGIGAQVGGTGCTTLVACLARLLVDAGKTVAIVDANFAKPGLASQLGLAAETGWEDVLSGRVSLAEAVVHSIGDRLSLLPLAIGGPAAASRLETIHASVTAGVLRYHYDIVLFDLGVVADPQQGPIARRVIQQCRLDGALVASGRGAAAAQPQQLLRSAPELATICLGVVENQLRAA